MTYTIYQLKPTPENIKLLFSSIRELNRMGLEISRENYDKAYSGDVEDHGQDPEIVLESIFYAFNMKRPSDFHGRSMSVSDVVELDGKAFFCNSCSWVPLENF